MTRCRKCKRPIRIQHYSRVVGRYRYHDACRPKNKKWRIVLRSPVEQNKEDSHA